MGSDIYLKALATFMCLILFCVAAQQLESELCMPLGRGKDYIY